MAHNDVYIKFMIEYDKANVTSSYPSLTKYEAAVILNKAYLALIAQKVTGNNVRRAPFEADTKAISDIQELITFESITRFNPNHPTAQNSVFYDLPDDFLYYVSGMINISGTLCPVTLVSHEIAQKFKQSISNRPWIKNAVAYIEGDCIIALYDNYMHDMSGLVRIPSDFHMTYIKEPEKFTEQFNGTFELNDTMAEELISLAVLFALENVESTRLQSKAQTRGLEA